MINLITGLPGSCKTLFTLKTVNDLAIKENREVYYHGIPDLILPWHLLEKPEDWLNVPNGSIVVIDECQSTFRPRATGSVVPPYVAGFETHRHKGLDFYLMTQHPMLLDGNVRRLTGRHYHCVRFYGFQKSTIHEFQQVRENVDKNLKGSIANQFFFPSEVFNWYKSADLHTMKKRIPMRLIMILVLPLFFAAIIYYGFKTISNLGETEKTKNKENAELISTSESVAPKVNYSVAYVAERVPVVADLPQSAEIYKDVVKPIVAPFPAACVQSKSKGCKCFTQQGTALQTTESTCQQIVEKGYFVDWQTTPKNNNKLEVQQPNDIGIIKGVALDAEQPRHTLLNIPS